jgi:hypothetical protein
MSVAELVPACTVTEEAGRGSSGLPLDSNTSVPPIGAALLSVTVHVVASPVFKLLGLHASRETECTCPKAAPADKQTVIATTTLLCIEKQRPPPQRRRIPYYGVSEPTVGNGTTGQRPFPLGRADWKCCNFGSCVLGGLHHEYRLEKESA